MRSRLGPIAILLIVLDAGCGKKQPAPVVAVDDAPAVSNSSMAPAIANLKNKDPEKRARGIEAITKIDADAAIPALLEILDDKGFTEWATRVGEPNSSREAAILALLKLGAAGEQAAVEKGLPILAAGLKDANVGVKEHTIAALSLLGPKAKSQTSELLRLCEDGNEIIRRAAYNALEKIGGASAANYTLVLMNADPKIAYDAAKAINALKATKPLPKEMIPGLTEIIDKRPVEGEPQEAMLLRVEVAEILASFGKDAVEALPALIGALKAIKEKEFLELYRSRVRSTQETGETPTMMALRKIGKEAVPALTEALDPANPLLSLQSAIVLRGIGPDAAEAIPALQKVFDSAVEKLDVDFSLVDACGSAIVQLGGDPKPVVAKIVDVVMKVPNDQVRVEAAYTLALFGKNGASATPVMISLLDDKNEVVRKWAIIALKAFGPGAKEAIPALAAKLADEDLAVRVETTAALKDFGPIASEATPALAKLLSDPDDSLRRDVIGTIIAIGPGAKAAVPELAKLIKSVEERERLLAIEALGVIGAEAKTAAPQLAAALGEAGDYQTRVSISKTLGQIGVASPEVVKALAAQLKDKTFLVVRVAAARALAQLGAPAKASVPDLQTFAGKSKESAAAVWAAVTLYKMGIDAKDNLQFVMSALKNKTPAGRPARLAAMDAADLLGSAGAGVVAELTDALSDNSPINPNDKNSPPVRLRAIQALGKMGPAAKSAVPKLTNILKEPDINVKNTTIIALGQIGPSAEFASARLREIVRTDPNFAEKAQESLDLIEKSLGDGVSP